MSRCRCLSASHGPSCPALREDPDEELQVEGDVRGPTRKPSGEIRKAKDVSPPSGARCRRCFKPIAQDGHDGHCSSDCFEAARIGVSQSTLRRQVFLRDGGVCAMPHDPPLDCEQLRARVDGLKSDTGHVPGAWNLYHALVHQLIRLGFDRHTIESGGSFWHADHIDPTVNGGPTILENARTLCLPHHREVTGELATERATKRRPFRRSP